MLSKTYKVLHIKKNSNDKELCRIQYIKKKSHKEMSESKKGVSQRNVNWYRNEENHIYENYVKE